MWESVTPETRDALQNALWSPLNDRIVEQVRSPLWYQAAEDVGLTDAGTVHRWRGWGLDDMVILMDRPCQIGAVIGFRDDWAAILPDGAEGNSTS
ncbi:MAG: hypothetical protein QOD39_224 [Mycobacterium sp.]|jgi:hypothetical protein|nr:hypothetical protein [Mycobacterium sp.]